MNEHISFGGDCLAVHLSLLFNAMVRHSFVPAEFFHGIIVPLLKCKHGDVSQFPVWARGRCRISPPCFLAECCKRQLNQVSFVVLYFRLSTFLICIEFVYLYFPVLFCLSVSVK